MKRDFVPLTLQQYIRKITPKRLAKELGVHEQTVYTWLQLRRAPSPVMAWKIIGLSMGLLDWEGIYEPYALFNQDEEAADESDF